MKEPFSNNVAYLLDVSSLEKDFDMLLASLTKEERERTLRYVKKVDQLLSLGKYLLLKTYTGDSPLLTKPNGKPYKEVGPYFSISHCYPYCVLFLLDSSCGVDIEVNTPSRGDFLSTYLDMNQEEGDYSLLKRWNIKESCYKAKGEGYMNPKSPLKVVDDHQVIYDEGRYYIHTFEMDDASIAFASISPFDEPTLIEVNSNRFVA